MGLNLFAVLACAVVSMIIGAVWYGPLFGKKWMEICKIDANDLEARKKMQQEALPLYLVQFSLTFFQAYILLVFIDGLDDKYGFDVVFFAWSAFVLPTTIAASMWTAEPVRLKWARFFIQAGYYFVLFLIFGLILSTWGISEQVV
jgi:hypothetical protein